MDKLNAVKMHVRNNKKVYITGAVCLVVGAVGAVALTHSLSPSQSVDKWNIKYKSPTENHVEQINYLIRRGHPGNVLLCNETGEKFASQKRAADLLGLNPSEVSRQVRGIVEDAGGYTFTNLGEASAETLAN